MDPGRIVFTLNVGWVSRVSKASARLPLCCSRTVRPVVLTLTVRPPETWFVQWHPSRTRTKYAARRTWRLQLCQLWIPARPFAADRPILGRHVARTPNCARRALSVHKGNASTQSTIRLTRMTSPTSAAARPTKSAKAEHAPLQVCRLLRLIRRIRFVVPAEGERLMPLLLTNANHLISSPQAQLQQLQVC